MMVPYIGITGFMSGIEVLKFFDAMPTYSRRLVMAGVLASSNTIQGIGSRHLHRYPKRDKMGDIFRQHPYALNLIHFNTKNRKFLFEQLVCARNLAGTYCHGFQLNMAWPGTDLLMQIVGNMPKSSIVVVQVGTHAFEMINHSPKKLADRIESEYGGLIHYVLLDASGGTGKPLDAEFLRPYLRALKAKRLPIGLGVAGGLSADTLDLVLPLVEEFPNLSIDAEGKLRDENDDLNVDAAILYRNRAEDLFNQKRI